MKNKLLFLIFVLTCSVFPQDLKITKIEPPNWWVKMKTNNIQLMVYGENLSNYKASFNSQGITVKKIYNNKNTNYSFIDISISASAKPGNYKLFFNKGNQKINVEFPLFKREVSNKIHRGFNQDDIIYLIMPDRFSDGDTTNNVVDGMINDFNPQSPIGRHGGDLEGIINHLNYFNELSVTALWLTPVLENNTSVSYHGYAATNLYKVDPRLGSNNLYKQLAAKAHNAGLKIIYDHVSNHIGTNHPWVNDPPLKDWFNGTKENHLNAWHDKMVLWDIHGAALTKKHLTEGWFVNNMADLNQTNPFVAKYLIQNTIWWIEYAGIDGIREDTYPYIDSKFTSKWAKEILNEYPKLNIVGEVWTGEPAFLAPYQKDSPLNKKYNSNLPVVTDFALQNAYESFLKGSSDLYPIFNVLAKDYLYKNPYDLLTFVDNHDLVRAMFNADGNADKVKIVFTHLLTSRGIPEIFYGTEIGMTGGKEDGLKRSDFPGGFPGDTSNAFNEKGRMNFQNNLFNFFKKVIVLRKNYKSLSEGKLSHLPPKDGVYIYSKKYKDEYTVILLNGDDRSKEVDISLVENLCKQNPVFYDLMNNSYVKTVDGKILLKPMSANIFLVE